MILKRPPEKTWTFKQPSSDIVPKLPGASGLYLSPSGGGKSTTLISMLLGPYAKCFDEVHVFSPSVELDSAWDTVKDFAKGLKNASFHSEWDEAELHRIMDAQRAKIRELKAGKTKKPLPQVLTIIDDFRR